MPTSHLCPECGAFLPDGEPGDYCAACLIKGVLDDAESEARAAGTGGTAVNLLTEKPGDRIGPYKLLQKIGEGGMGAVWTAEQTDPVRRRVALKVTKQGMDSGQVLARFEAERQALALMDHPNIAKVLDAGATGNGRPYFVMELVKGIPLTKFCDEQRLSIRERLELFVPVCQAIQHAHQKGVIHRDISPSNVLVALYDGRPVPKVIDFGIAKAVGQPLTERTLVTEFGAIIGKLEYMSPEQAEMNQLDIDTRSDVYSLGVLLYELLTGSTPLTREALRQAALDEVLRRIREQEPPRPSTRLSESKERQASISAQRKLDSAHLTKLLRGDLDWIVMKALEKERNRRYETANGLAQDILRHLRDEPVMAGPPTARYRLRKFVTKHRRAVTAAAGFVVLLAAATAVSIVLVVRADRQMRRALKAENDELNVLRFFQDYVLSAVRPVGVDHGLGHDVTIRAALGQAESKIGNSFSSSPLVEASIRDVLGTSYIHLGEHDRAGTNLARALVLFREHAGPEATRIISVMNNLASAWQKQGRLKEAIGMFEQALALRRRLLGPEHFDTLSSMNNLAIAFGEARRWEEALRLHEETLAIRKVKFPNHPYTLTSMTGRGNALRNLGRLAEAIPVLEEALRLHREVLSTNNHYTVSCMSGLAKAYEATTNRLADALPLRREVLFHTRIERALDHRDTADAIRQLASVCQDLGRHAEACDLFRELLQLQRDRPVEDAALRTMNHLANSLRALGRLDEATEQAKEALQRGLNVSGPQHRTTLGSLEQFVVSAAAARRADVTLPLLETYLERAGAAFSVTNKLVVDATFVVANAALKLETNAPALPPLIVSTLRRAAEHCHSTRGPADKRTRTLLNAASEAAFSARQWADAEWALRATLEHQRASPPADSNTLATTIADLGRAILRQARSDEAVPLLAEALAIRQKRQPEQWLCSSSKVDLGEALVALKRYPEAETYLLAGFDELRQRIGQIPLGRRASTLTTVSNEVAALYQSWGTPDRMEKWRRRIQSD